MTARILESRLVARIVRHLPRRPLTDRRCEAALADLGAGSPDLLAVAADAVSEEIASGLYGDPYMIGWIGAMAPLSDLAAAGARPLGVSTTLTLPDGFGTRELARLARGIGGACRAAGTVSLGGDTGAGPQLSLSAFAVGLVARDRLIGRRGGAPGEALYISGRAGLGNAFAIARLDPARAGPPMKFLPRARLKMGGLLGRHASCVIDTSDGVLAALDELSRVNGCGFAVTAGPRDLLHPRAIDECRRRAMPAWLALAGCHGEFELLFTVPPAAEERFLAEARRRRLHPRRIGAATRRPGVVLDWDGRPLRIDTGLMRNLAFRAAGDAKGYVGALIEYAAKAGREHDR